MKRLIILVCALLLALIPMQDSLAMQMPKKKSQKKEQWVGTDIKRYFSVPHFIAKLAVIFSDEKEDTDESDEESQEDTRDSEELTKEAIIAVISALKFGNFPIKKEGNKTLLAQNYIHVKKFKKLLESIINDYFSDDLASNETTARYIKALKKCLKIDAIQKDFPGVNVEQSLNNAIAYCKNNKTISIDKCISLEAVAQSVGIELKTLCHVEKLKKIINSLLKKEKVTQKEFFECLKLTALLRHLDFSKKEIKELAPALPGLLQFAIDYANKKSQATHAILKFFTNYPPKKKNYDSSDEENEEESDSEEQSEEYSQN